MNAGSKNIYKRKRRADRIIAFSCTYENCGQSIVLLPSKNGKIPVNYNSLTDLDKETLAKGIKIIYRYGVHLPHQATCKNFRKQS